MTLGRAPVVTEMLGGMSSDGYFRPGALFSYHLLSHPWCSLTTSAQSPACLPQQIYPSRGPRGWGSAPVYTPHSGHI